MSNPCRKASSPCRNIMGNLCKTSVLVKSPWRKSSECAMGLVRTLQFYGRYGFFQLMERFSDLGQALSFLLLYPLLILVLTAMWNRFNAYQGNYTRDEIYVYIGIAELLFLTFLRSAFLQRSQADFSMGLARPRSWLGLAFAGQFG